MVTRKRFKVPLYPCTLEVVIYDDVGEISDTRHDRTDYDSFCDDYKGSITIGISSKSGGRFITHEAHHAKSVIWDYIGYRPQADNNEVDAYLIQWIAREITNVYYKHKDGNKTEKNNKKNGSKVANNG